jgi:23S rRNA pseudouridine1911/1915/1917 synthase
MSEKLLVAEPGSLLEFLGVRLHGWSRSTLKQRLKTNCISVNGTATTQHNYSLNAGDIVEVSASPKVAVSSVGQLEILYQDDDFIAINKPAGLLSVGTAKETQQHALAILRSQLSNRSRDVKLWPVHRIDRDTSGVLLFSTSREKREALMTNWGTAEKTYLAIVVGSPNPPAGTIDQPLRLDEVEYRMHVGDHPEAKPAITHYQTDRSANGKTLLSVQLETGRQHQIRAHMAWLGHPVVGDRRYGTAGMRMGLHALSLKIKKPNSSKDLFFSVSAPADFLKLMT